MTIEELSHIGLSRKEATLYMYCIEHGPSRVKDISCYTPLNRGTAYDVARTLIKKGLISTTQRRNITHFIAHSPEKYMQRLNAELASAVTMLPTIETLLQSASYRPTMHFFEGNKGIEQVYEETLSCKSKEMVCFLSVREIVDAVGADFLNYYVDKRVRRHINLRCLKDPSGEVSEPIEGTYTTNTNPELLRESRPGPSTIDIAGNCVVFDDTVALMSTKRENFGVILHSHEFATMFKQLFETIWSQAEPPAAQ